MTQRESSLKQPDEPSVDEILASIRRIVFENDDKGRASEADVTETGTPAADVPAADVPAARAGRAAPESTRQPAPTDAPADAPADELPQTDEAVAGEDRAAAAPHPPEDPPPPEPPEPVLNESQRPDDSQVSDDPAGLAVEEAVGAGPGPSPGPSTGPAETVLLLTEMIAPDGSVVRIDPRPAKAPPPDTPPDMPGAAGADAGAGDAEGAGEGALDLATQVDLAATVREWLDRNAPGMVDRAARSELQKLAERQD